MWGKDTQHSHIIVGVPIPVHFNVINLIDLLWGITTFVIVGCMQMKILKKTDRFGVSNSQIIQNTETATDRCSTESTM